MDTESQIVLNESDSCSICLQTIDETLKCITNCNHIFCRRCLHEWFDELYTIMVYYIFST